MECSTHRRQCKCAACQLTNASIAHTWNESPGNEIKYIMLPLLVFSSEEKDSAFCWYTTKMERGSNLYLTLLMFDLLS